MLMKHKQRSGDDNLTTIKTSNESHLHWNIYFHKNPLYFRIIADFEADNETDNSSIGNKTTNIYKLIPVLNGHHIKSELDDVLKSTYHKYPLGYDKVVWFVNKVIKLEKKWLSILKKLRNNIMTKKNGEDFKNKNICRFCEKETLSDKVRDHCHLTGKYSGVAHSQSIINVTQKQRNFIPFVFHNVINFDCHMFSKS